MGILSLQAKIGDKEEELEEVRQGGGGGGSCTFLIIFSAACQNLVVPSEPPAFLKRQISEVAEVKSYRDGMGNTLETHIKDRPHQCNA